MRDDVKFNLKINGERTTARVSGNLWEVWKKACAVTGGESLHVVDDPDPAADSGWALAAMGLIEDATLNSNGEFEGLCDRTISRHAEAVLLRDVMSALHRNIK